MNDQTRRKFLIRSVGSLGAAIPMIYGCDSGGAGGGPLGPSATGVFTTPAPASTISVIPRSVTLTKNGTQTFTATGGTGSYTWSVSDTSLGSIGITTGAFTAGTQTGSLVVIPTDTDGATGSGAVTIISATIVVTPAVLTIPNDVTVNGLAPTVAAPFTVTFTASGGTGPYTFNISGVAAGYTGVLMNLTTGVLSVSSFPAADNTITVTATDTIGDTGTASVTIEMA